MNKLNNTNKNSQSDAIKCYKERLIDRFSDMAERGSLLTGQGISQQDLLIQLIGTVQVTE